MVTPRQLHRWQVSLQQRWWLPHGYTVPSQLTLLLWRLQHLCRQQGHIQLGRSASSWQRCEENGWYLRWDSAGLSHFLFLWANVSRLGLEGLLRQSVIGALIKVAMPVNAHRTTVYSGAIKDISQAWFYTLVILATWDNEAGRWWFERQLGLQSETLLQNIF